jgi:hypothetical protein
VPLVPKYTFTCPQLFFVILCVVLLEQDMYYLFLLISRFLPLPHGHARMKLEAWNSPYFVKI